MKPSKCLLALVCCVLLTTFSCSTEDLPQEDLNALNLPAPPPPKIIEVEILELINEYRISKDLSPLNNLDVIKSVAYTHTDYMVINDEVSHHNFFQRKASLVNYAKATSVGENVAYAYSTAKAVVAAWINSEGHRANIEGDFTDFDISAEQNENGRWYYTNIFIKR